ncbi:hypothetical protein KD801_11780 [Klebsiella pneumoniae]|uniref:hypothetical protein n=1 Tax=Klebsiella pneumoniae TaxID=573 RepID=UPI0015E6EA56|nr:hypothetical protein [Klebsiella pneumoniae]MBA1372379.1 hypothetical protein [Klebsiella pneumoniae]MBA1408607.1 hypothetical protein [Klebsiella pneumoniae]MBV2036752.1 hypothetical protein [Klebsiella pneumoniae]MBV2053482.1 hypothetical protein [Klebsiella pneumoniae]MBV2064499.1 hypothetical protein [Klebsiella pneumoniae]
MDKVNKNNVSVADLYMKSRGVTLDYRTVTLLNEEAEVKNIKPGTSFYSSVMKEVIYVPLRAQIRADESRPKGSDKSVKIVPRLLNSFIQRLDKIRRHIESR